jgi:PIN domain
MTPRRGVIDASVLYSEPIRSLLLWTAAQGALDPFWTARILDEARKNLIEQRALSPEQWEHLRAAMLASFPDAMLDQAAADAIEHEMPNHEKDRHVLAAAVASNIELVITNNLKHFKQTDLEHVGVHALDPDQFLCELLYVSPSFVREALENHAATMRKPRQWSIAELLGRMAGLGHADPLAPRFAAAAAAKLDIEPAPPPGRTKTDHASDDTTTS